jgi:hypothetical protein
MSDDIETPIINFTPEDPLISRICLVHTLISDLSKPGNTEEQNDMLRKAISLLFHSCYMEFTAKYPDQSVH